LIRFSAQARFADWQPALHMKEDSPKGWYSRGYLPHFDVGTTQFLTFRLADSLPHDVLEHLRLKVERDLITEREMLISVEKYLDQGIGNCYLRQTKIAEIVEENLLRFDGEKYKLHAWVIMPNHVHLLLTPQEGHSLSEIVHSCKSFTANRANKMLDLTGRFWFPEPFDRFIRDYEHFEKTFNYIESNPVKAKLCKTRSDWRFSSAWHRANGARAASPQ
jgi:putative DNA methylase